jgi:sigma-B regulation protein RsbU (phosphoserine phosphatase)
MEANVFQRIQNNLVEKRQSLSAWLAGASESEKDIRLGPATEQGVRTHLEVVEASLEQAAGQNLGVCEVCHATIDTELLEMDYTCCICLDHLSEPERRQLENELEFSQQVQRALLPQRIPEIAELKLAAFSRPAQMLSGDYFDFFEFSDGAPGLAIADAMGHGVSASMIMTSLQTALRTLAPESSSPAEVLGRVNRIYLHNSHFTTFVTVFLGRYDPDSHRLTYCNAGHNPPALYRRKEQRVEWLPPTGAAIGLIEDNPLRSGEVRLEEGDMLLLYTDGVTEATNLQQEAFGATRLADALRQGAGLTSREVVQSLRERLQEFTGEARLSDDVTMVVGVRLE